LFQVLSKDSSSWQSVPQGNYTNRKGIGTSILYENQAKAVMQQNYSPGKRHTKTYLTFGGHYSSDKRRNCLFRPYADLGLSHCSAVGSKCLRQRGSYDGMIATIVAEIGRQVVFFEVDDTERVRN